ncbi:LamG-like jellyroll fold domain-containing protein [Streptomyces sp. PT12]|uniref:LamG domain-containing protein n=1 Tax=Streptomyces sp. PT12 TaxID=1510197 RepID=UPI000DE391BF|nr:LamG-like jellyroll fold domain-containing protein [Streptomyces sp. PT12]RBM04650.1 hypothetical protein DEH69_30290 [Streptomyces sp. PT12]
MHAGRANPIPRTEPHPAAVFNNADQELVLYVDGERVDDVPWVGVPWEARGATGLGASLSGTSGGSDFFAGGLDEVRFYDYWLNDAQVAQLHTHAELTSGGRPATAIWALDEAADAVSVDGRSQRTEAQLHGGAETGIAGVQGDAVSFDGESGYALTSQPVLDTFQSFAVSLWAWLPADKENRYMTATTQGGASGRGFSLYHRPNGGGWSFMRATAPGPDSTNVEVVDNPCTDGATNCPALGLGTWTHVVGVHDMDARRLELYVNGQFAGSQPYDHRWDATGPVMLGASEYPDGIRNHMDGALDDVRFYDRVVSAEEVAQLYAQRPQVAARWQFDGTTGTAPVLTPDASEANNPLTMRGDAAVGPGWIDTGALVLDGVDDHAETVTVPVDTTASFTVGGWVQAAAVPEEGVTLFSAAGTHHSAFAVRFVPAEAEPGWGQWEITVPDGDAAGATVVRVANPRYYDALDWNHVAVVYDGFRREIELYVNGLRVEDACPDEGAPADCGGASWSDNVLSFRAGHSLQVGRTRTAGAWDEYWPGSVDDLWAFKGALNGDQIAWLSGQWSDIPTEIPNPR